MNACVLLLSLTACGDPSGYPPRPPLPPLPPASFPPTRAVASSDITNCQPFYDAQRGERWAGVYLDNAIRACRVTGSGDAANAIRKCLQEQTLVAPHRGTASATDLHRMHADCYRAAGCAGSPAGVWSWGLMNAIPLPSDAAMKWSINRFGPCSGAPGQFEPLHSTFAPAGPLNPPPNRLGEFVFPKSTLTPPVASAIPTAVAPPAWHPPLVVPKSTPPSATAPPATGGKAPVKK